jgi:CDP-diglyceride synthetase
MSFYYLIRDFQRNGAGFTILTLGLSWLGDTGGYFIGRNYGSLKIFLADFRQINPWKVLLEIIPLPSLVPSF